jgi:N-methylhydantoinase A
MALVVALDIGGTFTDLVVWDGDAGRFTHGKAATTPQRLTDGIFQCLQKAGVALEEVADFVHGSTIAINTVLERTGARTALVVTKGMRDTYAIGRQNRPDAYNIFFHRPRPLVPRRLTFELDERMAAKGEVLEPLSSSSLEEVLEALRATNIEAVAICLLHSYANPAHEARAAATLRAWLPGVYVSASSDILREYREYERTSSTVLNAYVGPKVSTYLDDLEHLLAEQGFLGRLFLMQSNGGAMSPEVARTMPVAMMESGPVGGIAAAAEVARSLELANVIAFDMGGTTAKASLVTDYRPSVSQGYYIGGYATGQPLMLPVVDVVEVGTGGGSIAEIDEVGALRVGPSSAGGYPGPICYGWGGTRPTVTDANLVLGRLSPDRFLGGEMPLDVEEAAAGIEKLIASQLSMSILDAAQGIVDLAMASMALAVRAVSIERGYDPREFALVAFGGAGPLHACAIAKELHIPTVVIPLFPGHFSAVGMLASNLRHDDVRTLYQELEQVDWAQVVAVVDDMLAAGRARLQREGASEDAICLEIGLDLRYIGQEFTLTTPIERDVLVAGDLEAVRAAFSKLHHQRYGHSAPTETVELVNLRVTSSAPRERPPLRVGEGSGARARCRRMVVLYRNEPPVQVPVIERESLRSSEVIEGPAIIEEYASTTLVWPGDVLQRSETGELVINVGAKR